MNGEYTLRDAKQKVKLLATGKARTFRDKSGVTVLPSPWEGKGVFKPKRGDEVYGR